MLRQRAMKLRVEPSTCQPQHHTASEGTSAVRTSSHSEDPSGGLQLPTPSAGVIHLPTWRGVDHLAAFLKRSTEGDRITHDTRRPITRPGIT